MKGDWLETLSMLLISKCYSLTFPFEYLNEKTEWNWSRGHKTSKI